MQHCQEFVANYRPCLILNINVLCGRNITDGLRDLVGTPGPYIELKIPNTLDAKRRTSRKDNEPNPVWNETFSYVLDPREKNILYIKLKDDNYKCDGTIGGEQINISSLERNKCIQKTITFNQVSQVDIELKTEIDTQPDIRCSLDLCEEELNYLKARKLKTLAGMGHLLGERGPKTLEELPTVAVMGSGGGFRAMAAYSGVFKALKDTGVLDCVTYTCGLSGSSWLLSTLYSHPKWPEMSLEEFQEEFKNRIDSPLTKWPGMLPAVHSAIEEWKKYNSDQPMSVTDFFGLLVGDKLLKERKVCKLTDQRFKIVDGSTPMPLYTCLHVKKNVSAKVFQEWIEFSPFEIGMAKFGSFIKSEYFGSKFFMGKLAKKYDEPPLHFLQGIWGNAFCFLSNDIRNTDDTSMIRREMKKSLLSDGSKDEDDDDGVHSEELTDTLAKGRKTTEQVEKAAERTAESEGPWKAWFEKLWNRLPEYLTTLTGRAGEIYNFLRHISLLPKSKGPDAIGERDSGENVTQSNNITEVEKLLLVDAGLDFNSPYPLVLRQARAVDIILSFDFSSRDRDNSNVFELKLAEKWAKHQGIPFPPVDTSVSDKEKLKELYIFRDPNDPHCPIVLHFVLVNKDFREYKKPGVPRKTVEEKQFADFSIFDDPYSTLNFTYTHKAFDRLSKLTEFNTLNHLPEIKDAIGEVVLRKRK